MDKKTNEKNELNKQIKDSQNTLNGNPVKTQADAIGEKSQADASGTKGQTPKTQKTEHSTPKGPVDSVVEGQENESLTIKQVGDSTLQGQTIVQLDMFDEIGKESHTDNEQKIKKVKELSVFTHSKKALRYIFIITRNAPKKYRWNIVSTMQKNAIDLLECLYLANSQRDASRTQSQLEADSKIKVLSYLLEMAHEMNIISNHQYQVASTLLYNCKNTLWGWIKCKL